eukprot:UN18719
MTRSYLSFLTHQRVPKIFAHSIQASTTANIFQCQHGPQVCLSFSYPKGCTIHRIIDASCQPNRGSWNCEVR